MDVLYHHAYARMDLGDRKMSDAKDVPLYGFTGNEVKVVGVIDLPVLFGSPPCQTWQMIKFHVINAISSYNAIMGRTTLSSLKAITSIPHLKMNFQLNSGLEKCVVIRELQYSATLTQQSRKDQHNWKPL